MLAAPASLACKGKCILRTQETTGQPEQPAFPAQWVTAYTWSPRCAQPFGHRRLGARHARLDLSVGRSGPNDFAVRNPRFVLARIASIASRLASGDDRPKRPSWRGGTGRHN